MQNHYPPSDHQPQPPMYSTNPIQILLSKIQNRTQFLCWLQIFLKAIFLLFLFLDGMFEFKYHRWSSSTLSGRDGTESLSFSTVTLEECYLPGSEWYAKNEFCHVLFYILIVIIAADLVLSILRAIKPEYTRKCKWQLVLPILILIIVVVAVIVSASYCDTGKILSFYDYETNTTSYYYITESSHYNFKTTHGDSLMTFYVSISIGFLFYITLLLGLVILAIDFYAMLMSNNNSFKKLFATLKPKHAKASKHIQNTTQTNAKVCAVCGKLFDYQSAFCDTCGNRLAPLDPPPTTIKCPVCEKICDINSAFCDVCGCRLKQDI